MNYETIRLAERYGLGLVLAIGIFFVMLLLLRWVLVTTKSMLDHVNSERKEWHVIQQSFITQLNSIVIRMEEGSSTNKIFFAGVLDAHKFQREEHKEMIAILGRINGYEHKGGT